MKYMNKSIDEIRNSLDKGEITSQELFKESIDKANKYQEDYNSFVTILDYKENKGNSIISGIPYSMKDNISTKGILTTGSSNILKDYIPIFDATIYKKLKDAGAILMGKTVLDELAMGGTGLTGHTGVVRNPWDKTRIMGGSSAGSASSVALGIVPFSIGSDTGDSIRKPAAYGGLVGFKPTYGRISRLGVFAFASSLDTVGVITKTVKDAAYLTDILKGQDPLDMVTLKDDNKVYADTIDNDIKGKKLFYFKDACDKSLYNDEETLKVLDSFYETIEKAKESGFDITEVEFGKELLHAIYPTYITISCAEATTNNSNLTGIPFGIKIDGETSEEIMMNSRTAGFSELIKRRFILGSYVLYKENQEKLFINAKKARRMIVDKMTELFKEYDGLIMPSTGGIAPKFDESSDKLSERYLVLENHMAIGNFGGFPSISIPSGLVDNMPVSINLTGRIKEDDLVLNMAHKLEQSIKFKPLVKEED